MKDVSKNIIKVGSKIRDAIENIDSGKIGITFVVDDELKFIGSISDGDVRRSMLKGVSLEESIDSIVNKKPIVGKLSVSNWEILKLYNERGIAQLPIVNEEGLLVEIKTAREVLNGSDANNRKENQVILMVGGVGSRLGSLTLNTPKPMLNIGGKPILQTILESFLNYGFYRFTLCVNHMSDQIIDHFGDGSELGAEINYIHEEKKMGTAGALGLLKDQIDSEKPFFVMNGDILTNINFGHFLGYHQEMGATASVCTREERFQVPFGVLDIKDHYLLSIKEKPLQTFFVNAGIYIFTKDCLGLIPENTEYDMPSLLDSLIDEKHKVASFLLREDWIDVGREEELIRAKKEYNEIFDK